jgi:amino-acid N-acetyltransferase
MMHELLMFPQEVVRQAKKDDIPQIIELLKEGSKTGSVLVRSNEEVEAIINCFLICADSVSNKLVGCASLEPYELPSVDNGMPGIAELRSVVSLKKGIGRKIVSAAISRAKSFGIKDVYATTDNPDFFRQCGFSEKRGGQKILWMDLHKNNGVVNNQDFDQLYVSEATNSDIDSIFYLMEKDEEVLPMDKQTLMTRLDSIIVCRDIKRNIVACVAAIIYPTLAEGGIPRMAEIRGLTVLKDWEGEGIEENLLDLCFNRFADKKVKQAFSTVTLARYDRYLKSGYFKEIPGGKMVLWLDDRV